MSKARKQTASSTAERFLGSHHRPGGGVYYDLPDLAESDIWYSPSSDAPTTSVVQEGTQRTDRAPNSEAPWFVGGLRRAFMDGRQLAASVPVKVPAWPSGLAELELEPTAPCEQQKEDSGGWVPPHVCLERRHVRASVVEGVGRTLKGRDASRVRDAVWSLTGFPEPDRPGCSEL